MITTLLLVVLVVLLLLWRLTARPPGLPPGPGPALPLLGHLHLLDKDPRAKFRQWRRQYGDVFSFYMGQRLVVVLNGYHVIKEALVKNANAFSVRPHMFIVDFITKNRGIAFNSGTTWKEQRKVSMEILRSLGMGKSSLSVKVETEVAHFIQALSALQGQPSDVSDMTAVSTSNNICALVFGRRFAYDDARLLRYLKLIRQNFQLLRGTLLVNFIPVLQYLPGDLFGTEKVLQNAQEMHDTFLRPQIQQHIDSFNSNDDDDFIGSYLKHMQQHRENGDVTTSINEENLQWVVSDLFVAGTETTATVLSWALLYLLHYPHIQEWCYQQICSVLPPGRPPCLSDRLALTRVEATVMEVLRIADVGSLSIQHGVAYDVMLRGYKIPEGSVVVPFLDTALNDEAVWGDPHNFRPQRFIDDRGQIVRPEAFIPMSIGRRVCLGESFARMELFLYLASLIQHFRFLPPVEGELPPIQGIMGLDYAPLPYLIRAVPRQ